MMSVSCAMGVETLRGAASGVRAVARPRSYTPGWVERAASHGQRAAAGLQEHEAREERRAERHQRQPAHDAHECAARAARRGGHEADHERPGGGEDAPDVVAKARAGGTQPRDRKSTRLNSSHVSISYAVFCLKKKNNESNTNHVSNFVSHASS